MNNKFWFRVFFHFALRHWTPSLQPEGFVVRGEEQKVCKLRRSIYGLKQAYPSQSVGVCGGIFVGNFHPRVKIFTRSSNYGNRPLSSSLLVSLCNESGFFSVRHVIWSADGYLFGNMKNSVKAEMNKWFPVIKLCQFLV